MFTLYAMFVGVGGFILTSWGPMWLGSHLQGQPWGKAALIRVAGAMMMLVACSAGGLAAVEDPGSRRRGLGWFGAGHLIVSVVILFQREAIWGPGVSDWVFWLVYAITCVLGYLWHTAGGDPPKPNWTMISLFGKANTGPTERLRSVYEQQIRQAAAQEERNRLARDLHDSIKQQIFAMQTSAATAQVRFDSDPAGAKQALEEVRDSARDATAEMEAMLDHLRAAPLENTGLVEAVKKQCEALELPTGARVDLRCDKLPPNDAFAPGAHQAIFRVTQEALANVGRHARARHVRVALSAACGVVDLRVRDDGAGFDPQEASRGMGVANMRARAEEFGGGLEIDSHPGGGTTVAFSVPCASESATRYRQMVLGYGVMLTTMVILSVLTRSLLVLPPAGIAAVGLGRETLAWLRTRRWSE